jgi:hypothetical protein
MRKVTALPFILAACLPLSFSGSNVPTDRTFQLAPEDIGAAGSDECAIDWITDDPTFNRDHALALLDDLGVKVVERKAGKFTTAMPRRLYVGAEFWGKSYAVQSVILTHELVHYCQRSDMGAGFERTYMHSAGRWSLEVPAFAQSIRTMIRQGASLRDVSNYIEAKLVSMRDFYWLHDIDPIQYDRETRRVWEMQE